MAFNHDALHQHVRSYGVQPTAQGYELARQLYRQGYSYHDTAQNVIAESYIRPLSKQDPPT